MILFKWYAYLKKVDLSIYLYTIEALCDYFEYLETLQSIEKPKKKKVKPISKQKKPKQGFKPHTKSAYCKKKFFYTHKEACKPKYIYSS